MEEGVANIKHSLAIQLKLLDLNAMYSTNTYTMLASSLSLQRLPWLDDAEVTLGQRRIASLYSATDVSYLLERAHGQQSNLLLLPGGGSWRVVVGFGKHCPLQFQKECLDVPSI
jgi:hypothetical protein